MSLRFILIGHPVGHSVSPALHAAAYVELGLDATYVPIDCPDEASVQRAVESLRRGEIHGANVTVPHKKLALALAERAAPLAQAVGAANVLCRLPDGTVEAHNTDVAALADELRMHKPTPVVACVLGSGGAALAAVAACRSLGAQSVYVIARAFSGASPSGPLAAQFSALGARPFAWPAEADAHTLRECLRGCEIIVQATSVGMRGADSGEDLARRIPWTTLAPGALAYDLVYNPPLTPFLREANAHGIQAVGGLGMLVGQAVLSVVHWTGRKPSAAGMRAAAEQLLFPGGQR